MKPNIKEKETLHLEKRSTWLDTIGLKSQAYRDEQDFFLHEKIFLFIIFTFGLYSQIEKNMKNPDPVESFHISGIVVYLNFISELNFKSNYFCQ